MQEKVIAFILRCVTGIYDALEDCVEHVTLAAGKRVLYVFLLSIVGVVFAIVCHILKIDHFIDVDEAVMCAAIAVILCAVDKSNQNALGKITKQIKKGKSKNE